MRAHAAVRAVSRAEDQMCAVFDANMRDAPAARSTALTLSTPASHPLAKRIGAWPSVAMVTAVTVTAAELVTRTGARDTVARR